MLTTREGESAEAMKARIIVRRCQAGLKARHYEVLTRYWSIIRRGGSSDPPETLRPAVRIRQALPDSGPSTRMIAAAMRRHSLCSRASSLRPARVSV